MLFKKFYLLFKLGLLYFECLADTRNTFIDNKYGVSLEDDDWARLFDSSIFSYNSGSKYALDKEASNLISDILAAYDYDEAMDNKEFFEDVSTRYVKECWEIFIENVAIESKTKSVHIGDERDDYRVLTVEFDNSDLSSILYSLIDYVEEDEELYDKLEQLYDDAELSKTTDLSFEKFWEELIEEIEKEISTLSSSDNSYKIEIVTPKMTSKMLRFTFLVDGSSIIEINFGEEGVKNSPCIEITVDNDEKILYTVDDSKKDITTYKMSFEESGEKTTIFELELQEKKDSYSLKIMPNYTYSKTTISGTYDKSFGTTTISIDKLETYDTTVKIDALIVLDNSDKMPKIKKDFINPLEISESELDNIGKRLEDELEEIFESLNN